MSKVILAHIGPPCDPPIVNGVVFHRVEGQLWLGETDEATAQTLTRVPGFRRYGGKLEVPSSSGERRPVSEVRPPTGTGMGEVEEPLSTPVASDPIPPFPPARDDPPNPPSTDEAHPKVEAPHASESPKPRKKPSRV